MTTSFLTRERCFPRNRRRRVSLPPENRTRRRRRRWWRLMVSHLNWWWRSCVLSESCTTVSTSHHTRNAVGWAVFSTLEGSAINAAEVNMETSERRREMWSKKANISDSQSHWDVKKRKKRKLSRSCSKSLSENAVDAVDTSDELSRQSRSNACVVIVSLSRSYMSKNAWMSKCAQLI